MRPFISLLSQQRENDINEQKKFFEELNTDYFTDFFLMWTTF